MGPSLVFPEQQVCIGNDRGGWEMKSEMGWGRGRFCRTS